MAVKLWKAKLIPPDSAGATTTSWNNETYQKGRGMIAVNPATIRRWNSITKMMMGMVMTTAAAAIEPIGVWNCDAPVKNAMAAGTVRARVVDVSEMANTKSFQQ